MQQPLNSCSPSTKSSNSIDKNENDGKYDVIINGVETRSTPLELKREIFYGTPSREIKIKDKDGEWCGYDEFRARMSKGSSEMSHIFLILSCAIFVFLFIVVASLHVRKGMPMTLALYISPIIILGAIMDWLRSCSNSLLRISSQLKELKGEKVKE